MPVLVRTVTTTFRQGFGTDYVRLDAVFLCIRYLLRIAGGGIALASTGGSAYIVIATRARLH
jgi:hypothetical protein